VEATEHQPVRDVRHRYIIAHAQRFPSQTLLLLGNGSVSVDGGPEHGSWFTTPQNTLVVRWHYRGIEAKSKWATYVHVHGYVLKSDVDDAKYCTFLIPHGDA